MSDKKELIRNIIEYHHVVRSRAGALGQSLNDFEALFALQTEYASLTQRSLESIKMHCEKLLESLVLLEEGLRGHFQLEENSLPDILGTILSRGLLYEHNRIRKNIVSIKSILEGIKIQEGSLKEISLIRTRIQQEIGEVIQLIERHASAEEQVLQLAYEGLENS